MKKLYMLLAVVLMMVMVTGCSTSSDPISTTTSFAGTQAPGDFWSWTIDNGAGTFTATNNTKSINYSGSVTALAGNSAGISKMSITNTDDPGLTTLPQTAYAIQIANTALLVATAPFYVYGGGNTQQSIHPPVFAAAQGSCPSTGVNVDWITMPASTWCSKGGDISAGNTCTKADKAYGTAAVTVSGGTYGITITKYELDGTAVPGDPVALNGCTCSNGVIQCADLSDKPVRISFTPSGVFFVDTSNDASVGIVQPSSNVDLSDFLLNGRTFKVIYHTALDNFTIFDTPGNCTSHGGTWVNVNGVSTCGTHKTQLGSATTNGTNFIGHPYTDIDNGTLSVDHGGDISFVGATQPWPGLIRTTVNNLNSFGGWSSDIVMAVRKVNGKYVALIITQQSSSNGHLGGGYNVLAVEQ